MSKKTILLAEDEKDVSEMYKVAFEKAGFRVLLANTGKETILIAKDEKPDVILLDINMPEKDGFEVLKEISEDWSTYQTLKNIPIIVVSNYSNPQDISYCLKMGAQDYIVKAEWTPDRIVEKINKYLADAKKE